MDNSVLDNLFNPIIIVDKKFKVLYFNHICSTFFKLPPRKLSKIQQVHDFIICKDNNVVKNLEQAIKQNSPVVSKEIEILLPESENDKMTVVLKMIPSDDSILINIWDVSLEKKLHEKYKEQIVQLKENHEQIVLSDKLTALGELISGIGHEVSNPLTIISDRIFSLNEALIKKDFKLLKSNLDDVDSQVRRVNKIISNLQSFVQNQDDNFEIVSIKDSITESIDFIQELNVLENIELLIKLEKDQYILGNSVKLQQVFINLIKNAIDALSKTKEPKITIELNLDEREQFIFITVEDNGPGIDEKFKEKLFEMFFTTKELGHGTGIGLSISQKIVESFYGQLCVEDGAAGAKFLVQIPFVEFSSFTKTNKYLNGAKDQEDPIVILIGDDLEKINKIFKELEKCDLVTVFTKSQNSIDQLVEFYDAKIIISLVGDIQVSCPVYNVNDDFDINYVIQSVIK